MTPTIHGGGDSPMTDSGKSSPIALTLAWLAVGIPLAWGVSQTLIKSLALFR
jgi:hypothetical protein